MNYWKSYELLPKLLALFLVGLLLQNCAVWILSSAGVLPWIWIPSLAIFVSGLWIGLRSVRRASKQERHGLLEAWSFWPVWLVFSLITLQILLYPPSMNDSLSYRIPRMFLWLQEGGMERISVPDERTFAMPMGWEVLALPFASLNLVGWCPLVNLVFWAVGYQMIHSWAREAGVANRQACMIAVALISAPVFVMQAPATSNDLSASVLLLLSFWWLTRYREGEGVGCVLFSLASFVLACGIKPHFLVLGLGWLVWWSVGVKAPRRERGFIWLVVAVPLLTLVSPFPTFVENYQESGSPFGETVDGLKSESLSAQMIAGVSQYGLVQLQPPIFPKAGMVTESVNSLSPFVSLNERVPKFYPSWKQVNMVDRAGLGLIHSLVFVVFIFVGWRTAPPAYRGAVTFSLIGFLIAISQVTPSTIGRSFFGFAAMMIPIVVVGLSSISKQWIGRLFLGCFVVGILTVVLNPAAPLWPARQVQQVLLASGKDSGAEAVGKYLSYQDRAKTGNGLIDNVPKGEAIALFIRGFTPINGLWNQDWRKHNFVFIQDANPAVFHASEIKWLIVSSKSQEQYPDNFPMISSLAGWSPVTTQEYRPTLSGGTDVWTLYQKDTFPQNE